MPQQGALYILAPLPCDPAPSMRDKYGIAKICDFAYTSGIQLNKMLGKMHLRVNQNYAEPIQTVSVSIAVYVGEGNIFAVLSMSHTRNLP